MPCLKHTCIDCLKAEAQERIATLNLIKKYNQTILKLLKTKT